MNDILRLAGHPTAVIADAAFRCGRNIRLLPTGLFPLKPDYHIAGPVTTVQFNNDLVSVLEGLMQTGTGGVLLIDNDGFTAAGCIGDVIVSEAIRRKLAGIVVNGSIRDSRQIVSMGLPVFCRGHCSVGPLKLPGEGPMHGVVGAALEIEGTNIRPGEILVADFDGVIVLESGNLGEVIAGAEEIEKKEAVLVERIGSGESLTDIFGIERFLEKRQGNPEYSFNKHLAEQNETI